MTSSVPISTAASPAISSGSRRLPALCSADHRADRADQDQQLRQRQRVPRRLRALAERLRVCEARCPCAARRRCRRERRAARAAVCAGATLARLLGAGRRRRRRRGRLAAAARAGRRLRERPRRPLLRLATASGSCRAGVRCAASTSIATAYAGLRWSTHRPRRRREPRRRRAASRSSALAGPFPVGEYAAALRAKLRSLTRVQLVGELVNLRPSRARVYFELRDATGAHPLRRLAQRLGGDDRPRRRGAGEGMQVVVAGGCDYYPGSATSSPGLLLRRHRPARRRRGRPAGADRAPAQAARRRGPARAARSALPRPLLPRTIGVITGESGKARDDVLAALARRGWAGRLVWGFAPVQDRHAAPAIVRALGDLAGRWRRSRW